MATSAAGEEPVYVVTTGEDGYGFSLTRFVDERQIELMVEDQTNCRTSDIVAELHSDRLEVAVSPQAVAGIGIRSCSRHRPRRSGGSTRRWHRSSTGLAITLDDFELAVRVVLRREFFGGRPEWVGDG